MAAVCNNRRCPFDDCELKFSGNLEDYEEEPSVADLSSCCPRMTQFLADEINAMGREVKRNALRKRSLRELKIALALLSNAVSIISGAVDDKCTSLGNTSESSQDRERYDNVDDAIEHIRIALGHANESQKVLSDLVF